MRREERVERPDERQTRRVEWAGEDGAVVSGYLCQPRLPAGRGPAVIVVPAVFGYNPYIEDVCRRLAHAGFVALGVDFYSRGDGPASLTSVEAIMAQLERIPDHRVVGDVVAGAAWLSEQAFVQPDGIGVLGFCVGGLYAFLAGCASARFRAVVNFYGLVRYERLSANKPVSPIDRVPELKAPMLVHYGDLDAWSTPQYVADYRRLLVQHDKPHEIYEYPGAPHAFHEEALPSFRPVAAATAWERSLIFLRWYLAGQHGYETPRPSQAHALS